MQSLQEAINKNELLSRVRKNHELVKCPQIIELITNNEYLTAGEAIHSEILSVINSDSELAFALMDLCLYVASLNEDAKLYVFAQKSILEFYLNNNDNDNFISLANELDSLLPNDADIIEMRAKWKKTSSEYDKNNSKVSHPNAQNGCDDDFYELISSLKTKTLQELMQCSIESVRTWIDEDEQYYNKLLKQYKDWNGVNDFALENGFIKHFENLYSFLQLVPSELCWLYENLADQRSKYTLKIILQHWLTFKPDLRKSGIETTFSHYFDLDVIKCDINEVFVDCGCYNGDTVLEYIKQYGNRYKKIYSYELSQTNYEIALKNLEDIERVELRNAGVSDTNGSIKMLDASHIAAGSANRIHSSGNATGEVVRIDDDIDENVTFIKMDVEGAEVDALNGARNQIQKNKPKLAISLYHKNTDILEIPALIKQMVPEYKLYLRNNSAYDFPFPTEYVLLATVD